MNRLLPLVALLAVASLGFTRPAAKAADSQWNNVESPTCQNLYGVWGTAADNVWAVGDKGTIIHYDGTNWKVDAEGSALNPTVNYRAILGQSASYFQVVGDTGSVYHDTQGWHNGDAPRGMNSLALTGVGGGARWWTVGAWSAQQQGESVNTSAFHSDTASWRPYSVDRVPSNEPLRTLWSSGNTDLMFAGGGTLSPNSQGGNALIYRWDNTNNKWVESMRVNGQGSQADIGEGPIRAIWGASVNEVWAFGGAGQVSLPEGYRIYRYDGRSWVEKNRATGGYPLALWGLKNDNIWSAGRGDSFFKNYNGSVWKEITISSGAGRVFIDPLTNANRDYQSNFRSFWGSGRDDVWSVGDDGRIQHYTAATADPRILTPCEKSASNKATLTIELPPKKIIQPKVLRFDGKDFAFNASCQPVNPPSADFTVTGSIAGTGDGQRCVITVDNIPRQDKLVLKNPHILKTLALLGKAVAYSPPPGGTICWLVGCADRYPYRIAFQSPVVASNIADIVNYVSSSAIESAYLSKSDCSTHNNEGYLCLVTNVKFELQNTPNTTLSGSTKEAIELAGVSVEGSIASNSISKLKVLGRAIAVGNTVQNVTGTVLPRGSFNQTKLDWGNIGNNLVAQYTRGISEGWAMDASYPDADTNVLNLNSSGSNPSSSTATSLSSPPEGKLWKHDGNMIFKKPLSVSGGGTLVVNGDLVFEDDVTCQPNTRFGAIVKGSITFSNQANMVGCGAYLAMNNGTAGGNITFSKPTDRSGAVNGIFVAENSVILPNVADLSGPYTISYDTYFAANPTILFKEVSPYLNSVL